MVKRVERSGKSGMKPTSQFIPPYLRKQRACERSVVGDAVAPKGSGVYNADSGLKKRILRAS